ncbi:MAG: InlB B-repeat-containing protein, partial [Ruminococcus sp.]|nr:InlB B-repeat-containing protein [Ruminococcus sp.]
SSNMVYDVKSGEYRGRHALCLIGYDDSLQAFKFINSWGTDWGLNGYGYISYSLFEDPNIANNIGYVITDATQHYKNNVYGVEANQNLGIYNDSALTHQSGMLTTGSKIGIESIIAGNNGNPPVLKTRDGKYITALTDKTTKLDIFKVRYISNGGSGSMSDTIVPMGVVTNTAANSFQRTGYTFDGWYARRESDNKWLFTNPDTNYVGWYLEGDQPNGYVKYKYNNTQTVAYTSSVNNDIVYFYARWKANTFTIVFNANGGTGYMPNMTITYGVAQNLRLNAFTKPGHTFKGWNVKRSSDNKVYYINMSSGVTGWYLQGSQPSGYVRYLYHDGNAVAYTSPVNNDVVTFTAYWD